jgi:hypothetical protein
MQAQPISTPKPKDATQKVADALAWRFMNIVSHPQQSWERMNLRSTRCLAPLCAALQSLAHVQLAESSATRCLRRSPTRVKRAKCLKRAFAGTAYRLFRSEPFTPRDIEILKDHIAQYLDAGRQWPCDQPVWTLPYRDRADRRSDNRAFY